MAIINNSFSALGVFFLEPFINQVFSCLSRNNKHQTTIMTSSSSPVLAGLPGDCCIKTKFKHTGPGAGKIITIAGIQTYISEPKETKGPKKIIFFLSDVFGPFLPHNEYIQDYFAQQGYTVLGPDYFFGDYMQNHTEPDFLGRRDAWFAQLLKKARAAMPEWLNTIREMYGPHALYCSAGYCFGASFTLDQAAKDGIVAAAIAHPSFLNEDHFKNITKPVFLSLAESDLMFPLSSRRRAEDILFANKATYHVQLFSGVEHGFAVRGDPEIENDRWAMEESARGIVNWLNRFTELKAAHNVVT